MTIGERDFYLDLLFYRCSLRRLVAIELKLPIGRMNREQIELLQLDRGDIRHFKT